MFFTLHTNILREPFCNILYFDIQIFSEFMSSLLTVIYKIKNLDVPSLNFFHLFLQKWTFLINSDFFKSRLQKPDVIPLYLYIYIL